MGIERGIERGAGLYYINGIFFQPVSDFPTYFSFSIYGGVIKVFLTIL